MALPQASASLPSGLRMRIRSCAAGCRAPFEQNDLVAADPGMPVGQRPRARGTDRDRIAAAIEHDEVVAEAVHLQERDLVHAAGYMAASRGLSNGRASSGPK